MSNPEYPWMQHVCYEPAPTLTPAGPTPIPLSWRIFWVVAVLFLVGCGLAGLSY